MIPIRVRQFPSFAKQMLVRSQVLRRRISDNPTFYLCFFSCHSYFRYLYCSLHSLASLTPSVRFKVVLFNDNEMPISAAQIAAIQALIPGTRIIDWPKSMGWGNLQIERIWQAYALVAKDCNDEDIIARVDSDVFFFNDRIFRMVERSDADLIGDGHFVNFQYAQGGCYFFRASVIRKINDLIRNETMEKLTQEVNIIVEDIVASYFTRRLGLKTWLTWFMMFPDELRNAGGLTAWQRQKFSCIHFVMKNKKAMLDSYERDVLKMAPPDEYTKALRIE